MDPVAEAMRTNTQQHVEAMQPVSVKFTDWRNLYPNKEGTEK